MIYDCFIFNNELDVLDIRLHELDSVVDKFVLVESTVTHVNKPKQLYFELNKDKYENFTKKIIHVVVRDTPDVSLAWIINDFQFSQMIRGLKNCKPEDIILFGDVDEIPKAEKVKEWKNKKGIHKLFIQKLSYYYLNLSEFSKKQVNGTHMMRYKDLTRLKSMWIAKYSKIDKEIPDGGWHFSYLMGIKEIQMKIQSMAHQEFNNQKYNTPEKIKIAMISKKDLFNNGLKFKVSNIDALPKYVQDNTEKFKTYILSYDNSSSSIMVFLIKNVLTIKGFARNCARFIKRTL